MSGKSSLVVLVFLCTFVSKSFTSTPCDQLLSRARDPGSWQPIFSSKPFDSQTSGILSLAELQRQVETNPGTSIPVVHEDLGLVHVVGANAEAGTLEYISFKFGKKASQNRVSSQHGKWMAHEDTPGARAIVRLRLDKTFHRPELLPHTLVLKVLETIYLKDTVPDGGSPKHRSRSDDVEATLRALHPDEKAPRDVIKRWLRDFENWNVSESPYPRQKSLLEIEEFVVSYHQRTGEDLAKSAVLSVLAGHWVKGWPTIGDQSQYGSILQFYDPKKSITRDPMTYDYREKFTGTFYSPPKDVLQLIVTESWRHGLKVFEQNRQSPPKQNDSRSTIAHTVSLGIYYPEKHPLHGSDSFSQRLVTLKRDLHAAANEPPSLNDFQETIRVTVSEKQSQWRVMKKLEEAPLSQAAWDKIVSEVGRDQKEFNLNRNVAGILKSEAVWNLLTESEQRLMGNKFKNIVREMRKTRVQIVTRRVETLVKDFRSELEKVIAEHKIDFILGIPSSNPEGFGFSDLFATAVGVEFGIPVKFAVSRETSSHQKGLDFFHRIENAAYRFTSAPDLLGKNVLIIDDVRTTGTSLERVRQLAYESNAARVIAVSLAQSASND